MLTIISLQIAVLTVIVILFGYFFVKNKKKRENRRDRALAQNLRISLMRRAEMERLRMECKK